MVDVSIVQLLFDPRDLADQTLFDEHGQLEEDYQQYLADLASYSLEQLAKEPDTLRMELGTAKQKLEDLASKNYKSFVRTYETVVGVHQGMNQVSTSLNSLIKHIPSLSETMKTFESNAKGLSQMRRANQVTLQNYTQLIELLEIPQLMDNCVRNKLYDESLEIVSFAQRLSTLHPDVPIISGLVSEVSASSKNMQEQLMNELQSSPQLPVCLRVVGYLRRLAVHSELELRICFLKCRENWFLSIVDKIPTDDPYIFLSKFIDACRVHLFEIITHYRAIFAEDTSDGDETFRENSLLHGWVIDKINSFIFTLKSTLPQITDGGYLSNILEQCMYYGDSLGRTSVDFRGLLPPIFEDVITRMFSKQMANALSSLKLNIDNVKWMASSSLQYSTNLPSGDESDLSPPTILMQYQPLALFTNEILSGFNELRQCALLSIQGQLGQIFFFTLVELADRIEQYRASMPQKGNEETVLNGLCKVTVEVFLPYILRCYDAVFGSPRPLIDKTKLIDHFSKLHKTELIEFGSILLPRSIAKDTKGAADSEVITDALVGEADETTPNGADAALLDEEDLVDRVLRNSENSQTQESAESRTNHLHEQNAEKENQTAPVSGLSSLQDAANSVEDANSADGWGDEDVKLDD